MEFNLPCIITENTITVVLGNKAETIESSNKQFNALKDAIKAKDLVKVKELVEVSKHIEEFIGSKGSVDIEIKNGIITYNGMTLDNCLVDRILVMQKEGFDIDPMINFLRNLMENPSNTAVQELYLFLEKSNLPLTPDGHFLAYKRVDHDYLDLHSRTFDNSVGKVVEMPRNQVDDKRTNTCSNGLHFCSLSYLSSFHSGRGHIMIVKINPKDVVSIPSDYDNSKGRTCRYEVIGEHELDEMTHAFDSSVYEDNDSEDEDYGFDDDYDLEENDDYELDAESESEDVGDGSKFADDELDANRNINWNSKQDSDYNINQKFSLDGLYYHKF